MAGDALGEIMRCSNRRYLSNQLGMAGRAPVEEKADEKLRDMAQDLVQWFEEEYGEQYGESIAVILLAFLLIPKSSKANVVLL